MPVWIRGCAPRLLRRTHAIIVIVLPICVAAPALAEEPNFPADVDTAAPAEALPSEQQVCEAPHAEPQGGAASNSDPRVAQAARLDPSPSEPVARLPAVSAPDTPAAAKGTLLGLRLPTFIALGIGGLGAGGAVVTHLAATAPYTDPKLGCNGRCADGSHTLDMTSTILAGLAVGALGTGVVLALSEPARDKKPLAPVLKMSVSPSKAAASASWTF